MPWLVAYRPSPNAREDKRAFDTEQQANSWVRARGLPETQVLIYEIPEVEE